MFLNAVGISNVSCEHKLVSDCSKVEQQRKGSTSGNLLSSDGLCCACVAVQMSVYIAQKQGLSILEVMV